MSGPTGIPDVAKGQPITADYLNRVRDIAESQRGFEAIRNEIRSLRQAMSVRLGKASGFVETDRSREYEGTVNFIAGRSVDPAGDLPIEQVDVEAYAFYQPSDDDIVHVIWNTSTGRYELIAGGGGTTATPSCCGPSKPDGATTNLWISKGITGEEIYPLPYDTTLNLNIGDGLFYSDTFTVEGEDPRDPGDPDYEGGPVGGVYQWVGDPAGHQEPTDPEDPGGDQTDYGTITLTYVSAPDNQIPGTGEGSPPTPVEYYEHGDPEYVGDYDEWFAEFRSKGPFVDTGHWLYLLINSTVRLPSGDAVQSTCVGYFG